MRIRLYNTLTRRVQTFKPITPGLVRTYHCGPTVYDYAHIGNFRSFLFADLLRRFFEFTGHRVEQVMNITDVGHTTEDQLADGGGRDKMELAAERLRAAKKQGAAEVDDPGDPYQVAGFFTRAFLEDARALGMKVAAPDEEAAHMPRATGHIDQMIAQIERLIERGHAYATDDGAVYYDVRSFERYGRLSGNTLDKLHAGAGGRVRSEHQAGKRHPADFLLWKADPRHLMKWDSPWGAGYPGWHIECSAMAQGVHGVDTIDIHTGGEDNIFPHHECEIAQADGATGQPFAHYWLHTRFLLVEGEKMSKSRGNFYTARHLLTARRVPPAVLRYELLRTHYRQNMNFTDKGLRDSARAVERFQAFADRRPEVPRPGDPRMHDTPVERAFAEALADDLNISAALGAVHRWVRSIDQPTAEDVATFHRIDSVLGVAAPAPSATTPAQAPAPAAAAAANGATADQGPSDEELDQLARRIDAARAEKDYAAADAARDQLQRAGVEVQTTKEGTRWRRTMRLS